jgi:DNA-binding transcriptional LysR family regulator
MATIRCMDSKKRLDLNLLVTLEALLAEQNVTRAASRLHLSQPALSAQLARLRLLFDDPLLIPTQRGMTPTAKALELLEPLRQALDQVRATLATHQEFDPERAEMVVHIACTDYLQAAAVQLLALQLRRVAPGVRLAVRNLDVPQLEQQMLRGEVDLALMTPHTAPPSLRTRPLFRERYVLAGRQGHPVLRDGLGVEAFAALEHVVVSLRGGNFVTAVDHALAAIGYRRQVVLSAASFLSVPDLLKDSDFVALVPSRLLQGHRSAGLICIEPPLPVEGFAVNMVWHERNHGHAAHRWVRDVVVQLMAEDALEQAPNAT